MSILPVGGVNCNYNKNIICLHVTRQQRFHSLLSTVGIDGIRCVPVLAIFARFLSVLPNFCSEVEYFNPMCIIASCVISSTASASSPWSAECCAVGASAVVSPSRLPARPQPIWNCQILSSFGFVAIFPRFSTHVPQFYKELNISSFFFCSLYLS